MRTFTRGAVLATAMAITIGVSVASPASARSGFEPQRPIQLALGDSWAAGAVDLEEGGYVNRLYDDLRERYDCRVIKRRWNPVDCDRLELRDIAQGGATTTSLIENQLPEAIELLEQRNGDRRGWNDVEVTTISIGGNDIFGPVLGACLAGVDANCVTTIQSAFVGFQTNLTEILASLRAAAGDADIVISTYGNPIPTCNLGQLGLGPLGAAVLEGEPAFGIEAGLNDITEAVAAEFDVKVAETFGIFDDSDWVGGNDCLHPNGPGHEKVKDAFLAALGL